VYSFCLPLEIVRTVSYQITVTAKYKTQHKDQYVALYVITKIFSHQLAPLSFCFLQTACFALSLLCFTSWLVFGLVVGTLPLPTPKSREFFHLNAEYGEKVVVSDTRYMFFASIASVESMQGTTFDGCVTFKT